MRFKWLLCLTLASTGLSQNRAAPATGEALSDALKGATQPLSVTSQGDLAEAGGRLIKDAIDHAHFALLGESHFSRETPQFAAAVCRAMRPDAYAVEAGLLLPLRWVVIRFSKDTEAKAVALMSVPEDICYVALGLVLGDVISSTGAFHKHFAGSAQSPWTWS